MRQEAVRSALRFENATDRLNVLREYLQASTLRSLHESQSFKSISFVGGTALRFLHELPRFSEDLDFSLEATANYQPELWLQKIKRDLEFQGFTIEVTWNDRKTVHVAWIKLSGILEETGIAARQGQKLAIKLEIDTHPPAGAVMQTSMVHRHIMFAIRHHDLPSLMAGKVRAIITRPFVKGRDWYDLLWYCSHRERVEPNQELLTSALQQVGISYDGDWRKLLRNQLSRLQLAEVLADVEPFLEHRQDALLLTRDNLEQVLR